MNSFATSFNPKSIHLRARYFSEYLLWDQASKLVRHNTSSQLTGRRDSERYELYRDSNRIIVAARTPQVPNSRKTNFMLKWLHGTIESMDTIT